MILTFGHSTLEKKDAIEVLQQNGVELLIDVRSHPSSKWEWWGDDLDWLSDEGGILWQWMPELGGWREDVPVEPEIHQLASWHGVDIDAYMQGYFPKGRIAKPRDIGDRPGWSNWGFYDYSWFMATEKFWLGMQALSEMDFHQSHPDSVAIMCAELPWWQCHRSMIADAYCFLGGSVAHIQPRFTRHSDINLDGRLSRYEPEILEIWQAHALARHLVVDPLTRMFSSASINSVRRREH